MTTPHVPFSVAGFRIAQPAAAKPVGNACAGCMNKAGENAVKNVQIAELKAEAADLREQVTNLQALVNAKPPTEKDFDDLHTRVHLLAKEGADARKEMGHLRRDLGGVTADRDSALRTIEDLRTRLRVTGVTP